MRHCAENVHGVNTMKRTLLLSLATIMSLSLPLGFAKTSLAQEIFDGAIDQEGAETLTRGPLHEAFAEPVTFGAEETLVIDKEPPAPIDELPPEYKPDDEDATWIPGYWGWDEERADFLWISGVWRVPPPGQRWVPGYWQTAAAGYEWVPGFWVAAETQELVYRPELPDSLEQGPTSPSPGDDHFYVPGCWHFTTTGYRWQPGYWHESYDNWIWVPARWAWTPRGVVFINGYWDYRLPQRGFVFAPVYFTHTVWSQPRFVYRPSIVLNINTVFNHLFVRPGYRHYYFGDYYGDRYARYNIQPAYQWHTRRGGYDPLMSFYTASYRRRGEDFIALSRDRYQDYVRHEDRRPAHTYREVQRRVDRLENQQDRTDARVDTIAARLNDVVRENRKDQMSFVKLEERQTQQIRERNEQLRDLTRERNKLERVVDRQRDVTRPDRATERLTLPKVAETRPEGATRTPRNRPGRDDVPRPIAQNERPDRDRPGSRPRPDVTTTPGATAGPDATTRDRRPDDRARDTAERGERPAPGSRVDPTDRAGRPEIGDRPGSADRVGRDPGEPGRGARDTARTGDRVNPIDSTLRPLPTDPKERVRPPVNNQPSARDPRIPERATPDRVAPGRPGSERPTMTDAERERLRRNPTERQPAPTSRVPRDSADGRGRTSERPNLTREPRPERSPTAPPAANADRANASRAAAERAATERARAERAAAERAGAGRENPRRTMRPEIPNVGPGTVPDRGAAAQRAAQEQAQRAAQEQAQRASREQAARAVQQQAAGRAQEQQQRAAREQAGRAAQQQQAAKQQAERAQRDQQRAAQQQAERAQRDRAQAPRPQERPQAGPPSGRGGPDRERGRGRDKEKKKD